MLTYFEHEPIIFECFGHLFISLLHKDGLLYARIPVRPKSRQVQKSWHKKMNITQLSSKNNRMNE